MSDNILQNFVEKQYVMAINQQLQNIEINLQGIQEVNYTFFSNFLILLVNRLSI